MNCTATYDELKGACTRMRPDFDWLQYAWVSQRGGSEEAGARRAAPLSREAEAVSWWLKGGRQGGADPFDPAGFVEAVARLGSPDGRAPSKEGGGGLGGARRWHEVALVGDSTARQQAVSLCCLLRAGSNHSAGRYVVEVTKAMAYMDFQCRVTPSSSSSSSSSSFPPVLISFVRFIRADSLNVWRPVERTPRINSVLLRAIARAPTVLVLNLGAWEFEDGCNDMHSLHDGLCNGTRPWVLHSYAHKWMLIAAALEAAYGRSAARHKSLVVWRAATPRDFEGGVAKAGGRCRRRVPLREADVDEWRAEPSSMRFAVNAKNLIMDAVAAQRAPWVRVLDAYGIARLRVDAHPGPDPKSNPDGEVDDVLKFDDCLHYCLPGMPDVFNGRLYGLIRQAASARVVVGGGPAVGVPGEIIRKWNMRFHGRPFVQGAMPTAASAVSAPAAARGGPRVAQLALQMQAGAPSRLECELPWEAARDGSVFEPPPPLLGFCSDLDPTSDFDPDMGRYARWRRRPRPRRRR